MVFGMFAKQDHIGKNVNSKNTDEASSQQASDHLLVTVVTKRPRAIVVLFGNTGATVETMSKYAQLYHDNRCSTICATAPILSLASDDTTTIGEVAITAARETARLIRMAEMAEMGFGRVPVVVHVLGNGGAQVLEELEKRIHEVVSRARLQDCIRDGSRASTPLRRPSFMQSGSSRSLMKSGSQRSLMGGSTRSLMTDVGRSPPIPTTPLRSPRRGGRPPLEKTPSAPCANTYFPKGNSTRSLVTEDSLSDDEEENPASALDAYEKLQAKLLRPKTPVIKLPTSGLPPSSPRVILKGHTSSPVCTSFTPPSELVIPDCGHLSPPRDLSFLPQCVVGNPLHRRLQQRRRRRKRTSPHVKRLDMERSAVFSSASAPRYNPEDRAYRLDLELFCYRLVRGSIVFDSGPFFPSIENELAAIDALLTENTAMKLLAQSTIVGSHGWYGMMHFNYLGYYPSEGKDDLVDVGRPAQFWKNMENLQLCKRHAFIYSQADRICKREELKKLISAQQGQGIQTIEVELVATRHLQHRKRRVDKYTDFIEQVLDTLEGRRMDVPETVDDWFDSDEEAEETGHETVLQHQKESGQIKIEPATA